MKKIVFSVGLLTTALAIPATAGCHKYSVWNYPQPQRCPVRVAQISDVKPEEKRFEMKRLPPFTVSKYDTIVLSPMPGRTDEEGRAQAIEILKQVMGQ